MDKNCAMAILRWFFGIAFVLTSIDKIWHFSAMTGYFQSWFGSLGTFLLVVTIIAELGGGLLLLLNKLVKKATLVLLIVMVVATIVTFTGAGGFWPTLANYIIVDPPLLYVVGLASLYCGSNK